MSNLFEEIRENAYKDNCNSAFLKVLSKSFAIYLKTSPRSNEKLKILHGYISTTLQNLIGYNYHISSLGIGDGKESEAHGRYMDKKVDIVISKGKKAIAGLAVKFVMSNYSQNSNNYFECMLGETANIRSNNIPYFQVFIIPDKIPYYDKDGNITKWEEITNHNLDKYVNLSNDNVDAFMHTPNKTFVGVVHISDCPNFVNDSQKYKRYYLNPIPTFEFSTKTIDFGDTVVYNDFDQFIKKVAHFILSL